MIQSEKKVSLERLVRVFPYPITAESRRRKLQRFLDLPQLTIALIWFPLIAYWLATYCRVEQTISIAIDRSQWGCINLLTMTFMSAVGHRPHLAEKSHPIILVFVTQIRKQ